MIADLRSEKEAIDEVLLILEKIAYARGSRGRGRPPAWMTALKLGASGNGNGTQDPTPLKRTRVVSPEAKRKMAEAQRRRWEAYRQARAGTN
ncbi:MAG TPA: hypothetical protein VKS01_09385 [Bryobacteraceae bacterium]|nr:hypothetical protein [Bryobacteraceae bacterium]